MHVVIFYFRLFIFHVFDKAGKKMLHAYTVALQNNCTISKVFQTLSCLNREAEEYNSAAIGQVSHVSNSLKIREQN